MHFMSLIQHFFQVCAAPHELYQHVEKVDEFYDWTSWLAQLEVGISGIGGPNAVHVFTFVRREGSLLRPVCSHSDS